MTQATPLTLEDHYLGALLGLAVGDTLGTLFEFCVPGSFESIMGKASDEPFYFYPGKWIDENCMPLCLAESLIECRGFDPDDQMRRYAEWWQTGRLSSTWRDFDIGKTTKNALQNWLQTGKAYSGSSDPQYAGNSSLMRLAAVPMFFSQDLSIAIRMAGESSRTTHAAPVCIDACKYFGGLMAGALRGAPKEELLGIEYASLPEKHTGTPLCPEIAEIANGSFMRKNPPDIRSANHVAQSLEAALWAFCQADDFEQTVLYAINLGGKAETTGAICGQLAGAFYGKSSIPSPWLKRLLRREQVERLALDLARLAREPLQPANNAQL